MRIAFVQMNCRFGEVEKNLEKAKALIQKEQADLFVLPELFHCGYLFESREELKQLAESADKGQTSTFLAQICALKKCHIVAGLAEKAGDKIYNSSILIGPYGYLATYRKIHLFDKETLWFDPGDTPFTVMDIGLARIGMMICFDWIFPEPMRSLALLGADVVCHPSNLVMPYCQKAMKTRCLENNVYAVTANRIGTDVRKHDKVQFTGQSQITGPRGEILAAVLEDEECVRVVDVDVSQARKKMISSRNDLLADRRPDFYAR